jgi:translation initiation factor eIF-2B subunit alpha
MAEQLIKEGVSVCYFPDCAMSEAVAGADMVLVGAVAVTQNGGIINKVRFVLISSLILHWFCFPQMGTRTLACLAKEANKDLFVAAETYKFSNIFPLSQQHLEELVHMQGIPVARRELPVYAPVCHDLQFHIHCSLPRSSSHPSLLLQIYSPRYDYTPPSYIRTLWTDDGIKTPSEISVLIYERFN